ncbi:YkgJ family cysteine cluster protein [Jannaschia formosa]|uniref:YkgJ family cysteine cluster protein n=1 Tax=Jannaschia formosa TaxID=2259592 RepID=UPI0014316072|nr:YkgJ family cysteine cluster protein [Jannaschia formosa]
MARSPRAARRAARIRGLPADRAALRSAVAVARLPGHPAALTESARELLLAWLDANRDPHDAVIRQLSDGTAATRIGRALLDRSPEPPGLACAAGCAFCCILPGEDGGTITAAEARALHAALPPRPPETPWHPQACPALDPDTKLCRAYDARPMICRTYVSKDVAACEAIAGGEARPGTGTLAPQLAYVTAHALARAALGTGAPTYALARVARAATEGTPLEATLKAARHPPRNLDDERRRLARGLG